MINSWARYPFVRFLIPLLIGIIACYFTGGRYYINLLWPSACLLVIILYHRFNHQLASYKFRWVFGFMVNALIFLVGYHLTYGTFLKNQHGHFSNNRTKHHFYVARVIDQPVEKDKTIKCLLSIDQIHDGTTTHESKGHVISYLSKDAKSSRIQYGDFIIFSKQPTLIEEPGNPGEFDYKSFLAHKSIHHRVFLDSTAYMQSTVQQVHVIKKLALHARGKFLELLESNQLTGNEYSVAAALFTGYDDLINEDQRQQFANSGIMHILCVSGLHVGIIFMLTNYLLFFLNHRERLQFLKPLISISIIWFYAVITGLAPPVCRAALMFTLIILGKLTRHQSNTYNTLAIAAFILLMINPRLLFDVGFQLSFIAVTGIIYFQPHLKSIYSPSNRVVLYMWDLVTVSVAAQLATAPITIYYFHKFANYFILSNLIAIPATGLIIYTGVFLVLLSFIPAAANFVALLLSLELKALNTSIDFISLLPGVVSENLYLDNFTLILLIILLLTSFKFFISKSRVLLYFSLAVCIALLSMSIERTIHLNNQKLIVFHKTNKHAAISLVNGRDLTLITDSTAIKNPDLLKYQLEGFKVQSGITNTSLRCFDENRNRPSPMFLYSNGKRIAIINNPKSLPEYKKALSVDYVYFHGCSANSILKYLPSFKGAVLVFTPNMFDQNIGIVEEEASKLGIQVHNLQKSGALVISLPERGSWF